MIFDYNEDYDDKGIYDLDETTYVREQIGREKYEIEQSGYRAETGALGGPMLGLASYCRSQVRKSYIERSAVLGTVTATQTTHVFSFL